MTHNVTERHLVIVMATFAAAMRSNIAGVGWQASARVTFGFWRIVATVNVESLRLDIGRELA